MKRCPYCLVEHDERGAFCCREHARATARQVQSERGKTRRALARRVRSAQVASVKSSRWRQIAMGVDVEENVRAIFTVRRRRS